MALDEPMVGPERPETPMPDQHESDQPERPSETTGGDEAVRRRREALISLAKLSAVAGPAMVTLLTPGRPAHAS